jgi:hypothetical protein
MRAIRIVAAALAGLLVSLAFVGVAAAGQGHHHHGHPGYPPVFNSISASPSRVCLGHKVQIKAQTFKPFATVNYSVRVNGALQGSGTVQADKRGVAQWKLPLTVKGTNKISAWGPGKTRDRLSLSVSVTVGKCGYGPKPSQPSSSGVVVGGTGSGSGLGGLLRTGAMVGTGLALLVAIIAGVALLFSGLRKRGSEAGPEAGAPSQPV